MRGEKFGKYSTPGIIISSTFIKNLRVTLTHLIHMKKLFKLFAVVGLASMTALVACQKPEADNGKNDEGGNTKPNPTYADVPFSKVTVTSDSETVEGTIQEEKYIFFHFNKAESFSDATLAVTVNEGYELTYPTTLEHLDLQAEPVLNFKTPENKTVKYWLRFSSDAFPIVDETKIHLEGFAAGEYLTIDNATKVFTVKYNKEKINYESVTIVFEDGALQSGATVKTDLTYDFTDGLEQPLVIDLGGDRPYTVKLDVTDYVKMTPSDFGFQDETFKYVDNVDNYPFLKVYRADRFNGIPVYSTIEEWAPANPYEWNYTWAYSEDAPYGGFWYDWVDSFSFLGNWAEDRLTMTCISPVVIVTVDRGAVEGKIVTDDDYSLKLGDVEGLVTVPGYSDNTINWNYLLYADGKIRIPLNGDGLADTPYRSAIGFTEDGKPSFATAVALAGDTAPKQIPFQTNHDMSQDEIAATAEEWDVVSAAWALPWIIRDGVAMKWEDLWNNDASRWAAAFGQGWQSMYPGHVVMGVTYDNKIAFMCNPGGSDNWDGADSNNCPDVFKDGGWFKGITVNQMAWLAIQMGWKELTVISGQNGEANGNASTIRINGKSVFHQEDHPYLSPEPYANEGADVNCAYAISLNKR